MGLLDFIFGKKNKTKISTSQSAAEPQAIVFKQTTSTSSAPKVAELRITPFVFESNQHQRYENGNPVTGLQKCPRVVKVEKNVNGCNGYQLKSGDGYIVHMINGDTGQPQMSAKPMRVVKSTATEVTLRGYMVRAQTPFGFQDVDMADYGLTISLKDGKVVKCALHMYDRNVDIEYKKTVAKYNSTTDRYTKMVQQASFNPFKITTDPSLQNTSHLPNYIDIFKNEIQTLLDKGHSLGMPAEKNLEIFKGYIFSLIESYYNNAGYVPKNSLDEILVQTYKAAKQTTYATSIPSLDEVKYQMYYAFLNN